MTTIGFKDVNISPVAGSRMGINYLLGCTTAYPVESIGGIWPSGETQSHAVFAAQFDQGQLSGIAPASALFSYAINNGVSSDVVSTLAVAHAMKHHSTVFGANIIAMSHPGVNHAKLVGLEVDVEPSDGNVVGAGSGGIYVNAFNESVPGAAMQIGGVGGGTFQNGIVIDGVSGAGVAPGAGSVMMSALNTSAGNYVESAIVLGNQHGIKMNSASGNHVAVMTDTGGNLCTYGSAGFIFQKNSLAEGSDIFSVRDASGVESISAKIARGSPSSTIGCALRANGQSVTGRSINAGGTVNSNGADYAEYERVKDGTPKIEKGQIIGFDVEGLITTRFDHAVSFGVKTTDPSFVGGDAWAREVGVPPSAPVYEELDVSISPQPNYSRMSLAAALRAKNIFETSLRVRDAEMKRHRRGWERKYLPPYLKAVAAYEAALESERQKWDRIAYCGKVPVNVYGSYPGDWIIPARAEDGGITANSLKISPTKAIDAGSVGRVVKVLPDGRALISVLKI